MSAFITGKELENKIGDIIFSAKKTLLIVSQFIKLDDYFKQLFNKHIHSPELQIIIIFGKNEGQAYKSLSKNDFEYFQKFNNISIIYIPDLHGKYYGNEDKGVITSINLYDKSFEKNIEFGFYSESSIMDKLESGVDKNAWDYCNKLANTNDIVFIKRPIYKKKLFGITKELVGSSVLLDQIDELVKGRKLQKKRLSEFPAYLESDKIASSQKPAREYYGSKSDNNKDYFNQSKKDSNLFNSYSKTGYCIRCNDNIPYNPRRPFCNSCYVIWAQFENEDYNENFCHSTGRASYGNTSKRNPILKIGF